MSEPQFAAEDETFPIRKAYESMAGFAPRGLHCKHVDVTLLCHVASPCCARSDRDVSSTGANDRRGFEERSRFSDYVDVVELAGLGHQLTDARDLTVFAPTDSAFERSEPSWRVHATPGTSSNGGAGSQRRQAILEQSGVQGVHPVADFAGRLQDVGARGARKEPCRRAAGGSQPEPRSPCGGPSGRQRRLPAAGQPRHGGYRRDPASHDACSWVAGTVWRHKRSARPSCPGCISTTAFPPCHAPSSSSPSC